MKKQTFRGQSSKKAVVTSLKATFTIEKIYATQDDAN